MVRDSVVDTTGVPRVLAEKTSKYGPNGLMASMKIEI